MTSLPLPQPQEGLPESVEAGIKLFRAAEFEWGRISERCGDEQKIASESQGALHALRAAIREWGETLRREVERDMQEEIDVIQEDCKRISTGWAERAEKAEAALRALATPKGAPNDE